VIYFPVPVTQSNSFSPAAMSGLTIFTVLRHTTEAVCTSGWCYTDLLPAPLAAESGNTLFLELRTNDTMLLDSIIIMPAEFYSGRIGAIQATPPAGCQLGQRSVYSTKSKVS